MSIDDRLRDSLHRTSSTVDPDLTENLRIVRRKTRRVVVRQRVMQVTLAVAAIVGLVVATPTITDFVKSFQPRPGAPVSPSQRPDPQDLVGSTYSTDVPRGSQVVEDDGLAGIWTMQLEPNGVATMSGPPSFSGVLSGVSFQVSGNQFRINLFVQDLCSRDRTPGVYEWTRSGAELILTTVQDPCAARVAVLTSRPWVAET
jgi:hypothetical protein